MQWPSRIDRMPSRTVPDGRRISWENAFRDDGSAAFFLLDGEGGDGWAGDRRMVAIKDLSSVCDLEL